MAAMNSSFFIKGLSRVWKPEQRQRRHRSNITGMKEHRSSALPDPVGRRSIPRRLEAGGHGGDLRPSGRDSVRPCPKEGMDNRNGFVSARTLAERRGRF